MAAVVQWPQCLGSTPQDRNSDGTHGGAGNRSAQGNQSWKPEKDSDVCTKQRKIKTFGHKATHTRLINSIFSIFAPPVEYRTDSSRFLIPRWISNLKIRNYPLVTNLRLDIHRILLVKMTMHKINRFAKNLIYFYNNSRNKQVVNHVKQQQPAK